MNGAQAIQNITIKCSPTRPSGPSWSESRHVRVCVCLMSPSHVIFFSPLFGPQIGPQQSASSTSSSICNLMMKTCVAKPVAVLEELLICSKAKAKPLLGPQIGPPPRQSASSTSSSICNLMMKTCVAKPVGVLEELLIYSKAKAKPLIGPQIGSPPRQARPSAIS